MIKEEGEQNLDKLKTKSENLRQRAFMQMIYIAFIFGVPAAVAFLVGDYFDDINESGRKFKVIFLAFAFVISWVITIIQYRRIDKEFKEVERKIKEEKEK